MTDRPRNSALAAFLVLLAPGLGQIYNGEWAKALVLLAISIPTAIVFVLLLFSPWFQLAMPFALIAVLLLFSYAMVDAIVTARRLSSSYELKPFNRVFVYVALVLVFGLARDLLTTVFRTNFIQAFRIPSESMMPTLIPGDFVYADRRPIGRNPSRDDLIVFRYPVEPERQFIMRVVGVTGDRIEVRDKQLLVNGRAQSENHVIHIDPATHPGSYDPRDSFGPYVVPRDSYFVLGDNRDNSNDSRFFGPVHRTLVDGTVRGIYWSWDQEHDKVRWDRVGRLLQ